MMTKDEIASILSKNVATVSFTKSDGTVRDMLCTLREDFIPQKEENKKKTRKASPDTLPVWDVENSAWRSFRIDSVDFIKINSEDN